LLKAIPGLALVDLHEADWCCGSAGIYNITKQEMGSQLLDRKMNNIVATGASTIATGNPGCFMQIALGVRERSLPMDVVHPVQLLDEAYRAGGLYSTPTCDGVAVQRQQRALFIGIGMSLLIGAFLLGRRRQN
jgi:glycolate oxidase iron-sulfur subunit